MATEIIIYAHLWVMSHGLFAFAAFGVTNNDSLMVIYERQGQRWWSVDVGGSGVGKLVRRKASKHICLVLDGEDSALGTRK